MKESIGQGQKKKVKNTNQNKNPPFSYPPIPPCKNWDADCFPGLWKKLDGPNVGKELLDWDKTKSQGRRMDRSGNNRQKYMKTKIFGKYRILDHMNQGKIMDWKILEAKWRRRWRTWHC